MSLNPHHINLHHFVFNFCSLQVRLWLDYNETSAYFIDKGVSKNIMAKKFKTIDFSQIDKPSDVIGREFDKLLTIEIED